MLCFRETHARNLRLKSFGAPEEEEDSGLNKTDIATYSSLARNCKVLSDGRCLHARIARTGHDQETFLGNLLIQMYGNCGSPEEAREVFERLQHCNVFSWTIMMAAYVQNHENQKALQLFCEMDMEGVKPDRVTFINVLSACSSLGALADGKAIHARIVASGYSGDLVTGTALVNMYGKCGSIDDARSVFQEMQQKDLVSWNAMLSAYVQDGYAAEALGFFRSLLFEGIKPNKVTFKCILSACSTLKALEEGQLIHALIVASGYESDCLVGAAVINMYCKCKSIDLAVVVLHGGPWNLLSCNILVAAYSQYGDVGDALRLFWQMHLEGVKPDKVTFMSALGACCSLQDVSKGKAIHAEIVASGLDLDVVIETALVKMYATCNSVNDARSLFLGMKQRDLVSWNAMIAAFALSGLCKEALSLFWQMNLEGVKPNELTFSSIFYACASLGTLSEGRSIHAWIMGGEIEADVAVGTALVNMYSRGGHMVDAVSSFTRIARGDTVSWNALIVAFAQHGHCLKSLQMR